MSRPSARNDDVLDLRHVAPGDRGKQGLARLNTFVTTHRQVINAAVCFLFALVLGVPALQELL